MNFPNLLTLLRIFFVPVLVAALVGGSDRRELLALAIFLAAAATDLLDGYLARRWGQVTTIGTLLDPIADKLLVSAALISLVQVRAIPAWMAIVLIGREFAISGLRSIAASEGYVIQASDAGKTKMVFQVIAVSLVLLALRVPEVEPVANIAMIGAVLTSFLSAALYFRQFWGKIDDRVKRRRRRELLAMVREQRRRRQAALSQSESVTRT
jgi:CDP-diacylglycerol--glycerol-3-phosphate 3-phosphatidyltransferase